MRSAVEASAIPGRVDHVVGVGRSSMLDHGQSVVPGMTLIQPARSDASDSAPRRHVLQRIEEEIGAVLCQRT